MSLMSNVMFIVDNLISEFDGSEYEWDDFSLFIESEDDNESEEDELEFFNRDDDMKENNNRIIKSKLQRTNELLLYFSQFEEIHNNSKNIEHFVILGIIFLAFLILILIFLFLKKYSN